MSLTKIFDSCNLMSESSDVLSCLITAYSISEIVKIICAHPVYIKHANSLFHMKGFKFFPSEHHRIYG
jgi:hypothetical protein